MATTTTTQLGDSVPAELVADRLIATAYAAVTADRLIPKDYISGGLVRSYPRLGKVTAAAMTEGTDGTTTTLSDTQVSATVAEVGIGYALTDLLKVGSGVSDIQGAATSLLGQGYADKVEVDVLALSASLTDTAGTTTVALTEDTFFQAGYEMEANDAIGVLRAYILYPKQWHQVRIAISGVTENQSTTWGRADFLDSVRAADIMGYKTSIDGDPIYISSNVPSANAGADSGGMVIAIGDMAPFIRLIGVLDGQIWDARLEYERDASLRATEGWVTGAYGVAVPAPDRGCRVLSAR